MRLVSQWKQKIIHLANMRQSQRQTTDFILKAEKQKGVAYRELLANLYQHLLEKCLTAGAADMNRPNYCPVNSSTQVAGQFPSQAYLFVYIISKAWGRSASLWRPSIKVLGHQDMKQGSRVFIGQKILLVTPLYLICN